MQRSRNLTLLLLVLVLCSCHERPKSEEIWLWGDKYVLKPAATAEPVDLSGVEIVGYCSEEEKVKIARCLGRIPMSPLPVKEIAVVWPEQPLAARAYLDRGRSMKMLVFLVKDRDGEWRVQGSTGVVH